MLWKWARRGKRVEVSKAGPQKFICGPLNNFDAVRKKLHCCECLARHSFREPCRYSVHNVMSIQQPHEDGLPDDAVKKADDAAFLPLQGELVPLKTKHEVQALNDTGTPERKSPPILSSLTLWPSS